MEPATIVAICVAAVTLITGASAYYVKSEIGKRFDAFEARSMAADVALDRRIDGLAETMTKVVYEITHTNDGGTVKGKVNSIEREIDKLKQWAHLLVHQLNREHPGTFAEMEGQESA